MHIGNDHAETENYIFLSNLGLRHKVFVKELQHEMETVYAAYEQLIAPRTPISAVSVVRLFATEMEYLEYVGIVKIQSARKYRGPRVSRGR